MCIHATGRIFCPISIKIGRNVPFVNILVKFVNQQNRSTLRALLGGTKNLKKWFFVA